MKPGVAGRSADALPLRGKAWVPPDFRGVAKRMAQITEERNRLLVDAFGVLEAHYDLLAQALVQATGGRSAAARWMCARQKAFGGQTAYDLISEGDVDRVWDSIRI